MKTALIALTTAFGLVFALADTGFAQDRPTTSHGGQIKSGKVKRSLPLRTSPQTPPETRGGMLDEMKDDVVYF
jgi:hypothetical protein